MSRPHTTLRRLHQAFFDGPAVLNYPGRATRGYRSLNLVLSQWMHAFFVTRFTCAGGMLFLATLIVGLGGMTTLLMPLYLLFVTLAMLFVINIIVGFATRPQITLRRIMPDSVTAGQPLRITYELANTGKLAAWDLQIDYIPMNPAVVFPEGRAMVAHLDKGEATRLTLPMQVNERGRYLLPRPVADSAFPFGLWRWGCMGEANRPLLVLPRYTALNRLTTPPSLRLESGNAALASRAGDSLEFMGCREFRFGDNPRFIHAQSWARHNEPVVKEFSDAFAGRVSLFIDSFPGGMSLSLRRKHNAQFEAAMSMTAAIADYFATRHCAMSLFSHEEDGRDMVLRREPDLHDLSEILEVLAGLPHHRGGALPAFSEIERQELTRAPGLMLLLLSWDTRRREFVDSLREMGVDLRVIVIGPGKHAPDIDDAIGFAVSAEDVLAGDVRDL
ncbi:MAG: hypothetical protein ACI8W8_001358 [Rhodothermales bacterium]|jgi:uncharacterized protein (DUF58 family)